MGFFSYLFGSGSDKYSAVERSLSEVEIKKLVSRYTVNTLSESEEPLVEQAIMARRKGDGRISLRQIDQTLRSLVSANKISKYDREKLMKVFVGYFSKMK